MTAGSGFLSHADPNESQTVRALNDARLVHVPAEPERPARHVVAARVIAELIAVIFGGEKIDAVSPTVDAERTG